MVDLPHQTLEHPAEPGWKKDVEAFLTEHPDLDTVEVVLPDTNGVLRGKWLPGGAVETVFAGGVALPYSLFGLDVWGREVESTGMHIETGDKDGVCWPIPETLKLVPWAERKTAQVLLSMYDRDGVPCLEDPRHVLKRMVDKLAAYGVTATCAFELEFYLLEESDGDWTEQPKPLFTTHRGPARQNMYALSDLEALLPVVDDLRRAAEMQGIPADAAVSEAAPGQFELNLHHRKDPLLAADDAVLLRRLVQGVARKHNLKASFMAKPFVEWPGNGMHVHVSMEDENGNIFACPDEGAKRLGHAISGLLDTMPEALLLFTSTFNGFRRMQPGSYAPTSICWGFDNRSVALRVPASSPQAARIEHRIAGADANPYFVLVGVLAGMLLGLQDRKDPPPPVVGNAYEKKHKRLTPWMDEAIDAFEASDRMKEAVGPDMHKVLTEIKKEELNEFGREISSLERQTYL
ncbi:glutamine synthetase family protein [Roseibium polysiphoniae]|uniref:Glutamine synthetase n=1 Tax=Roseibium polysiphoniae TaxID=2571221 RepID=A0A927KDJ0_9HYPH|nr:glutamine synthetase family protein [Roseibium polysiphoniae]MBD8878139.1 glutamine synthetase [Roseibium polysiphoniae]MBS8261498.1 glutamine synthetase [Roseibium polysiphoniae]